MGGVIFVCEEEKKRNGGVHLEGRSVDWGGV